MNTIKTNPTILAVPRVKFFQTLEVLTDEQKEMSAFISINGPDPLFVEFEPDSDNYLNLRFSDVDVNAEPLPGITEFTDEMAVKVSNFVQENRTKKMFMIHCLTDMRRSGAIAEAIANYLKVPLTEIVTGNLSDFCDLEINESIKNLLSKYLSKKSSKKNKT